MAETTTVDLPGDLTVTVPEERLAEWRYTARYLRLQAIKARMGGYRLIIDVHPGEDGPELSWALVKKPGRQRREKETPREAWSEDPDGWKR